MKARPIRPSRSLTPDRKPLAAEPRLGAGERFSLRTPAAPARCRSGSQAAFHVFFVLAAATLIVTSCSPKSDPQVLARVGPSEIRVEQFRAQMARRGGGKPESLDRQALLEEMIEQEALYVKAVQAGLDKDPEVQRACRNLLIGKLRERELAPRLAKVEVTAEELRAAYDHDRPRHLRPAAVRLAALYLPAGPAMKEAQVAGLRERMAEARRKALEPPVAGAPGFGTLAIAYSEDQATRYKGGEIGWVEAERGPAWLGPAVRQAAGALKSPGDLSEVISDFRGVYLVKLIERRDAEPIPFSAVEPALRQRLLAEKRQQLERSFAQEACGSVPVEIHADRLANITPPISHARTGAQQPPSFP
jgi:peptidyl-prolyl cis-trans isomerase C